MEDCRNDEMNPVSPEDGAMDNEIAEAVRDVVGKKAEMKSWKRELEHRRRNRLKNIAVFVPLVTAAACAVICVLVMKPSVPEGGAKPGLPVSGNSDVPVLRGGTSYDLALQRADSLISAGDCVSAEGMLDSLVERAGYEKALLDDVLRRAGELRYRIGSKAK